MKIQLITILTISVISNKFRINWLIGVIAFSIGFYGIKGGVFSILHGGQFKIWGPDGSFIADNNHLALALLMVLPLFYYLQSIAKYKVLKMVLVLIYGVDWNINSNFIFKGCIHRCFFRGSILLVKKQK